MGSMTSPLSHSAPMMIPLAGKRPVPPPSYLPKSPPRPSTPVPFKARVQKSGLDLFGPPPSPPPSVISPAPSTSVTDTFLFPWRLITSLSAGRLKGRSAGRGEHSEVSGSCVYFWKTIRSPEGELRRIITFGGGGCCVRHAGEISVNYKCLETSETVFFIYLYLFLD